MDCVFIFNTRVIGVLPEDRGDQNKYTRHLRLNTLLLRKYNRKQFISINTTITVKYVLHYIRTNAICVGTRGFVVIILFNVQTYKTIYNRVLSIEQNHVDIFATEFCTNYLRASCLNIGIENMIHKLTTARRLENLSGVSLLYTCINCFLGTLLVSPQKKTTAPICPIRIATSH